MSNKIRFANKDGEKWSVPDSPENRERMEKMGYVPLDQAKEESVPTVLFTNKDGKQWDIPDLPENHKRMEKMGYSVVDERTFGDKVLDTAKGAANVVEGFMNTNPATGVSSWIAEKAAHAVGLKTPMEYVNSADNEKHKEKNPPRPKDIFVAIDSNGAKYDVANTPENIKKFTKAGFTIHSAEQENFLDLPSNEGGRGAATSFKNNTFNMGLFGVPEIIQNRTNPEQAQKDKWLDEAHPIASALGNAFGVVSAFIMFFAFYKAIRK